MARLPRGGTGENRGSQEAIGYKCTGFLPSLQLSIFRTAQTPRVERGYEIGELLKETNVETVKHRVEAPGLISRPVSRDTNRNIPP